MRGDIAALRLSRLKRPGHSSFNILKAMTAAISTLSSKFKSWVASLKENEQSVTVRVVLLTVKVIAAAAIAVFLEQGTDTLLAFLPGLEDPEPE
jgi:hypothetical protein